MFSWWKSWENVRGGQGECHAVIFPGTEGQKAFVPLTPQLCLHSQRCASNSTSMKRVGLPTLVSLKQVPPEGRRESRNVSISFNQEVNYCHCCSFNRPRRVFAEWWLTFLKFVEKYFTQHRCSVQRFQIHSSLVGAGKKKRKACCIWETFHK